MAKKSPSRAAATTTAEDIAAELAAAADLEDMSTSHELQDEQDADIESESMQSAPTAAPSLDIDKEEFSGHQPDGDDQDPGLQPTATAGKLIRPCLRHANHSQSELASAPPTGPAKQMCQLTLDKMRETATELFPDGASAPAVPAMQPPAVSTATNRLCDLALTASDGVKRVKGKLGGYEVIGYLVAHYMGVELVANEAGTTGEALELGTSARGYALRARSEEKRLKGNAHAAKSKLRKNAGKDAALAARLDAELQKLDVALVAACLELWRSTVELSGLPDAKTVIVERRPPQPAPQPSPQPARQRTPKPAHDPWADMPHEAMRMYRSEEMAYAMLIAFAVQHNGRGNRHRHFHEELHVAEVRYAHALRRLKVAYPGTPMDGWGERSFGRMVTFAFRCMKAGYPIPTARNVVREIVENPDTDLVPVPPGADVSVFVQSDRLA
jgi:hypothetical protein